EGFSTFGIRGPRTVLSVWSRESVHGATFAAIDASTPPGKTQIQIPEKQHLLKQRELLLLDQDDQRKNPDSRIVPGFIDSDRPLLSSLSRSYHGLTSGDSARLILYLWELQLPAAPTWIPIQGTVPATTSWGGLSSVL